MDSALTFTLAYADQDAPALVRDRRRLHAIPELALCEEKTSACAAEALRSCGLEPEHVAGTGLAARLSFARPGKVVLLRADMDGLPVAEDTGLDYASEHAGRMHACGHDGHMAMLLGAARALVALSRSEAGRDLCGGVIFAFQPGEEGQHGARLMVESGLMRGVDYCLAAHIWPDLPEGVFGVRAGPIMASVHEFDIHITGEGGHGAQPQRTADALDAAAQLACALQHVVSRRLDPMLPAVLSLSTLQAGEGGYNIIPGTARIAGCARGFHPEVVDSLEGHIRSIAEGVCAGAGVRCDVCYRSDDGPVVNDPRATEAVRRAIAAFAGPEAVREPPMSLVGEDFSRFLALAPGCMVLVGAGRPGARPLHNPRFTFADEKVLPLGVKLFCASVLELLKP